MSDFKIKRADGKTREISGYIYSAPNANVKNFRSTRYSASQLPKKVDLRPYMTRVEDQGQVGSCTANAVAGAYEYLVKKNQGLEDDYDVSRLFIYYGARAKQGNEKKDSGSAISDAVSLLEETGACSEYTWPYSEQKSVVFAKPSKEAFEEASRHKITEAEIIPTTLQAWKSALAEGFPIIFGISLFKSFDNQRKRGFVPNPSSTEAARGSHSSHAMLCVGYSDVDRVFIVRNSWGDRWGDNGYCYISYDYIMNKKYNHGDTWIIRDAEEVEGNEDSWFDDDESVLTDLNEEFANMDEETWEEMNEKMGDYPFPHRLGLLFTAAAIVDGEFSEEEQEVAIEHIGNALELFGYDDLDPEGVFEYASEVIDENENILNETVELFGEYLSGEALATILQQMREIAGADELDEEESDFIDTVESAWMGGDDDEDEDEEECDCDDDEESECDEDEEDEDLDEYETFTVTLGGPNSDEPSYLSICDQEAYSEDDDDDCLENVEIVFTGTKFVTASKAKNDIVSENENEAEIETLKKGCDYSFVTSTGYEGRIIVEDGEMDGKDAEIEVTVYYCESDD